MACNLQPAFTIELDDEFRPDPPAEPEGREWKITNLEDARAFYELCRTEPAAPHTGIGSIAVGEFDPRAPASMALYVYADGAIAIRSTFGNWWARHIEGRIFETYGHLERVTPPTHLYDEERTDG